MPTSPRGERTSVEQALKHALLSYYGIVVSRRGEANTARSMSNQAKPFIFSSFFFYVERERKREIICLCFAFVLCENVSKLGGRFSFVKVYYHGYV